jgi:hypothetical protein
MREGSLREIFNKTNGHCHFCGDPINFKHLGWSARSEGHWEADHVIQKGKGGPKTAGNCPPACTRCNRLRWHRKGDAIRELLLLGIIAMDEIKKGTAIGLQLKRLLVERPEKNEARRNHRKQEAVLLASAISTPAR